MLLVVCLVLMAIRFNVTGCAFRCYWLCIPMLLALHFDVTGCAFRDVTGRVVGVEAFAVCIGFLQRDF